MNCGLIGYPLGHSYSRQIHHALADYDYHLWELKPEELAPFLEKRGFAGINVTIPYKEQVIPYLDGLSDTARAVGAVNTVMNRDGRLLGDNTDLPGTGAVREEGADPGHRRHVQDRPGRRNAAGRGGDLPRVPQRPGRRRYL